ncbi:hypothetical protein RUM43_003673 [Polyplax serrata]|uniref:PH domain-containing protein n=1 Tax=Polyplax serrata TaxID=468196 RepID=A0AAN8PFV9_POLSC
MQAPTDEEYEKWVRILAVELIRQTPLQNVRFLDILSIIRHKETSDGECLRRGRSAECMIQPQEKPWATCPSPSRKEYPGDLMKKPEIVGEIRKMKVCGQNSLPTVTEIQNKWETNWMRTQSMNNLASPVSDESGISSGDEIPAESSSFSISRDVDDFSFLSVRERKKFFESLNVADEQGLKWTSEPLPLSRSNSIGNLKISFWQDKNKLRKRKRTKSLHDLHKTPVREICQLFESRDAGVRKGETEVEAEPEEEVTNNAIVVLTERRLQRGERKLEKLRNQITEVEESIAAISADLKAVKWKNLTGQKGLDLHLALHRRLDDERCRLERLMEEATRIIKGNQRVILKLERSNEKSPRTV